MPTPHHLKNLGVIANRYRLAEAARENLILSIRCITCRRPPVMFLATDLVKVLDPGRDCFHPPPFPCSQCGSDRTVEVKLRSADAAQPGVVIRRLVGTKTVPIWRNEMVGGDQGQG